MNQGGFIFIFAFLFVLGGCYSVERNCKDFRVGTFSYTALINNELQTSIFVRDTLYEIESFQGKIDSSSIRWVNDCEFILTKLNPKNNKDKRPIRIKILTTDTNQYTFEYASVGNNKNVVRGTVYKIKSKNEINQR
ncbi:MAG: DNA topoisomerase IV [Flavobacteriaceae bacterium]|nr:DNA topoisomerase IV [Flavobacteriaceae bacterium]